MRTIQLILILLCLCLALATRAEAAVQTVREDSESPFVSIAKSTFYGAVAGSAIGVAIMLVANGNDDAIFKVAFVGGTALGLGYGIYHVSTRPSDPSLALIQFQNGRLVRFSGPVLSVRATRDDHWLVSAPVVSLRF